MDRRAWQATVHGITKSWTLLSDIHSLFTLYLHIQGFHLPLYSSFLSVEYSLVKKGEWKKIIGISDEFELTVFYMLRASLVAQTIKNLHTTWETQVQSLDQEDPLGKGMATHSSILAWEIPWTEEPGRLQSMGSQRVKLD